MRKTIKFEAHEEGEGGGGVQSRAEALPTNSIEAIIELYDGRAD